MVSSIPGIDFCDPDLTETSKGFSEEPNLQFDIFSNFEIFSANSFSNSIGKDLFF